MSECNASDSARDPAAAKPELDLARIEATIREFDSRIRELESQMGTLSALVGTAPESPLSSAVYNLASAWCREIESRYGIDGWLNWWWLETYLGDNPRRAGTVSHPTSLITTIDDLIPLIIDDISQP